MRDYYIFGVRGFWGEFDIKILQTAIRSEDKSYLDEFG